MRRFPLALLGVACLMAGSVRADDSARPPETLLFKKTGALAPVSFPHAAHAKRNACKDCHEGDSPIFPQKFSDETGMKMADMYSGKSCGACHNGAKEKAFAAKGACMKCHKKEAK